MAREYVYRVPLYQNKKQAGGVGQWSEPPVLLLPVTAGTLGILRGLVWTAAEEYFFEGTPEEVQQAIETLSLQASAETVEPVAFCNDMWGAQFQAISGGQFQAMQGAGLPPAPWEFRLVDYEDGGAMLQFRTQQSDGGEL